ncbi:MAG: hypothetical protein K9L71_02000 [Candidatus Omnitrophica bacterium]|nr:hypothetical protein [Candidatus Omnitrophota bacterium]
MLVKKAVVFSLIFAFISTFFLSVVLANAELVGKHARLIGPRRLSYIGLARTGQSYRLMELALERKQFENIVDNFDIVIIENNIAVCVLDIELFKNKARVLVLEGLQEGITGWVPLSWLPEKPKKARLWH